ncbi:MAG: arsenite methyltransferase [Anaerolineales bacterium]
MTQVPIHEVVREHYAERARNADSCCGADSTSACCDSKNVLYPEELITTMPDDIANFSLGCGDPITLAALQPGQSVLDLGSGGGLDCFLAAKKVGESGHVIGVDMTPEMLEKARASAKRMGVTNVEFRHGFLEDLPVDDNSVDVVISNCVINLSPDKTKVFNEVFRVLSSPDPRSGKPGGKLAVSDIVTDGPLPDAVKQSLSMWAGCVAGAVDAKDYIAMMENAGFTDISVTPTFFDKETVDEAIKEVGDQIDLNSVSQDELYKTVYSARITARKQN